jgi:NADH-quinone oxidoreductase subunit D
MTADDIPSRFAAMAHQVVLSLRLMSASLAWLLEAGPGAIDVQLPKVVRAPELTHYGAIDGPLGITGVLLDSVGDKSPWRLKLRTPAFATIQSLQSTLIGLTLDDLVTMVQSCAFVIGDADR